MAQVSPASSAAIVLAHTLPFRLGKVEVYPATRQVIRGETSETLEPRVMQVLVALAEAQGAVLTREELIERCWDGRIVGENAIHRVISRVREVATTLGADAFRLETITKVGYRMIVGGAANNANASLPSEYSQASPLKLGRRHVLGGATMIGVGALSAYFWKDYTAQPPSSPALTLYRKGVEAQRQGLAEQTAQAGAYFLEATKVDPSYAPAWGALALHYRLVLEGGAEGNSETLAMWSRSAAKRALQLNPQNADAEAALILIKPWFRNWATMEADCRKLIERYPHHWLLRGSLGRVLCNVGRWGDGVEPFREATTRDPFLPIGRVYLALALWGGDRLQEAENAIESASQRWPSHPAIWFLKFNFLAYTGRADRAIKLAEDTGARPFGVPETQFASSIVFARALASGAARDVDPAVAARTEASSRDISAVPGAVQFFAALGRIDIAFALLKDYFAVGLDPTPIGPFKRRQTDFLFMPQTAAMRADPRFGSLTKAIGLNDYWRTTGTMPDYRR